jgi:hypothetical protein
MALNPHFSLATRNAWLDRITTDIGTSAIFNIYAGVQPADVSAAVTAANVIIATLSPTSSSAFAAASAGSMTANTITSDSSAVGGTAAWFSITKSTGARVLDGSVGTATSDLVLNSVSISTGATVSIAAFTITSAA